MMDFDALHVFTTVVNSGGFNAAATALHKSQPAVTASVKKLEDQLGLILFNRDHYRPTLTPAGEQLFQRAKSLLTHWQHINQFANNLKANRESDITIAIESFYPLDSLKDLFTTWMNRYPQTHFHFLSESIGGACERLTNHQADLIISENLICSQAVEVIPLRIEPMIAVATPEFIRQHAQQLQSLDTLSDCMQVILRDSSTANFSFGVVENCRHWTVSDVIAKKQIITAGLGWGRLPGHLIAEELQQGQLIRLEGNHFDQRLLTLSAIRLQKPAHGPIAGELWDDLLALKFNSRSGASPDVSLATRFGG